MRRISRLKRDDLSRSCRRMSPSSGKDGARTRTGCRGIPRWPSRLATTPACQGRGRAEEFRRSARGSEVAGRSRLIPAIAHDHDRDPADGA
jgi:hypothetical protein